MYIIVACFLSFCYVLQCFLSVFSDYCFSKACYQMSAVRARQKACGSTKHTASADLEGYTVIPISVVTLKQLTVVK